MKNGGPHFSQALLNAILSHSVRWCRSEPGMDQSLAPFDDGAAFSKDAVRYLFEDVQHGSSKIPTVQALLLLSAQECGRGNRTQAWLYSGMAFRLIDDMGICVDGKIHADAGQFSAEDIEIRIRLFWSCYFWDKLISLYFGRSPLIQNSEISPARVLSKLCFFQQVSDAKLSKWMTQQNSKHGRPMASCLRTHRNRRTLSLVSFRCVGSQRFSTKSLHTFITPRKTYLYLAPTNALSRKVRSYETGGATFQTT